MKKSGGEIPKSDEHRKIPNSSPSPPADRVSPSFDSHLLRRSERIWQKNRVNKLDSVLYVQFAKDMTIFHFDPEDVVKCNFAFPDGWRRQHRGEEGGADHGHLDTDDGELIRVPRSRDPHAVHGDRHGDTAPGGGSGPCVAVVGPAAARQEAVKKLWLQGGSTARPTRWAAGASFSTPTSHSECLGGTRPGGGSRSCPRERLAPLSPPVDEDDFEGGSALGRR